LHLNDYIDSEIFHYDCFEKDTTEAIRKSLRPGMTVFDIGANIGAHVLPMAKIVGPQGKIIAFEPMQWAQKKLIRNVELNDFSNIVIENIALSNKTETKPAAFRASWNKFDAADTGTEEERTLQFEKLDDYIHTRHVQTVDFIKLDVDGFEYKILESAVGTLKKFKPTISMELGNWTLEKQGDSLLGLVNFLFALDYRFLRESDFELLEDFNALMREFPDPNTWTINVIVVHSSKEQEWRN